MYQCITFTSIENVFNLQVANIQAQLAKFNTFNINQDEENDSVDDSPSDDTSIK